MRPKVTVVGAGSVGSTCAQRLAERDYADLVVVDALDGVAHGTALDIAAAAPLAGYEPRVTGTNGYEETAGSRIVVIAVGSPGRPGTGREELMAANAPAVREVAARVAERSPDAIVVVVAEPAEALCHVVYDVTTFPRERVIGVGARVASARLRTLLAVELGASVREVDALVLGGDGDLIVPVTGSTAVGGVPILQLVDESRLGSIVARARDGRAVIAGLLGTRSASVAAAAAVVELVDAVVRDQLRLLPCAALCRGEYGIEEVFVGVPARVGGRGIEEVVEVSLSAREREALARAADAVRALARTGAR